MTILVSVVSPVYRAEGNIEELVRGLHQSLLEVTDDYEIILIEDGSKDNSWEEICKECSKSEKVKGVKLSRNFGQHPAIFAGLAQSKGSWIVVMDCDLQDPPQEIPKLLLKAKEGFDIVLARRESRQDKLQKRLTSYFFYSLLSYLTDSQLDHRIANFGVYSRRVVDQLLALPERFRSFPLLVRWVGFSSTTVSVKHQERFAGESSYTFRKAAGLALDIAISFSDRPLRICIKLGLAISLISLLAGAFVLVRAFTGSFQLGWPSVMVSIWFLSGLLLAMLGVVGVYVGRVFQEVKSRPIFLVEKRVNLDEPQKERFVNTVHVSNYDGK